MLGTRSTVDVTMEFSGIVVVINSIEPILN